jgi:hypothetical protein
MGNLIELLFSYLFENKSSKKTGTYIYSQRKGPGHWKWFSVLAQCERGQSMPKTLKSSLSSNQCEWG